MPLASERQSRSGLPKAHACSSCAGHEARGEKPKDSHHVAYPHQCFRSLEAALDLSVPGSAHIGTGMLEFPLLLHSQSRTISLLAATRRCTSD